MAVFVGNDLSPTRYFYMTTVLLPRNRGTSVPSRDQVKTVMERRGNFFGAPGLCISTDGS